MSRNQHTVSLDPAAHGKVLSSNYAREGASLDLNKVELPPFGAVLLAEQ